MFYKDLTSYCNNAIEHDKVIVYPKLLNIGWLDREHTYPQAAVSADLLQKLKEITFLDLKNNYDEKNGNFDKNNAIILHQMHIRGSPHPCSFCESTDNIISLAPSQLTLYTGGEKMILGTNEICIPALKPGYFYVFPTMLYHYIDKHHYCPPAEFLNALAAFDMTKPYDIEKEQANLECKLVPIGTL